MLHKNAFINWNWEITFVGDRTTYLNFTTHCNWQLKFMNKTNFGIKIDRFQWGPLTCRYLCRRNSYDFLIHNFFQRRVNWKGIDVLLPELCSLKRKYRIFNYTSFIESRSRNCLFSTFMIVIDFSTA